MEGDHEVSRITICVQCKKQFSNHANEPWCDPCKKESDEWDARLSRSKSETESAPKNLESNTKTQPSPQEKPPKQKREEKQTPKSTDPAQEQDTMPTPQPLTLVEPTIVDDTERNKMQSRELTIMQTKSASENSSMQEKIGETLPVVSMGSSDSLNQELSRSISLLNKSEDELFASMKGLRADLPETTVRLYDPDRVQTAVLCGRQIVESMKTKLELMKFAKEVSGK